MDDSLQFKDLSALLEKLGQVVKERPEQLQEAFAKLDGEPTGSPDPAWLPPERRRRFVESVAHDVGLTSAELMALYSVRGTLKHQ